LWLRGRDLEELASWRRVSPEVHLVHSDADWRTHRRDLDGYLHEIRYREHVLLFAWGAQRAATIRGLQRIGVDGIMGNHVESLVASTAGSSALTCDAR
jgi:hypothetical protein